MLSAISRGTYRVNARAPRNDEADKRPHLEVIEVETTQELYRLMKKLRGKVPYTREAWAALKTTDPLTYNRTKEGFPWYVGGEVRGVRNNANVVGRSVLTFDLERYEKEFKDPDTGVKRKVLHPDKPMATYAKFIRELREKLEGMGLVVGLVVYKSTGYTDDEPRYRVLVLLDTSMSDKRQFKRVSDWLATKLGFKPWVRPESVVMSGAMFAPMDFEEGPEDLVGDEHTSGLTLIDGPALSVAAVLAQATLEVDQPYVVYDLEDEQSEDPVLIALREAGLEPVKNRNHDKDGAWDFQCPHFVGHDTKHTETGNDSQTTYWPATKDRGPGVKCFDTELDHDGPHLTYRSLVQWLKDEGYLRAVPRVLPVGTGELPLGRLIEDFMDGQFVYDHGGREWLRFDAKTGYTRCEKTEHVEFVVRTVEPWLVEVLNRSQEESPRWKKVMALLRTVRDRGGLNGALDFARSMPRVAAHAKDFDTDPWTLGVRNGIVDLKTGGLRPHTADAHVRRRAGTDWLPDAKCPAWDKFLARVQPDADMRDYLQLVAGYCLTGDVSVEMLFFLQGEGNNGKSTFLETLQEMLGMSDGYAEQIDADLLMHIAQQRQPDADRPTPQLLKTVGKRLVVTGEVQDHMAFSGQMVKTLASTTRLSVRPMRCEAYTVAPTAKVLIQGNPKPRVLNTEEGFWRRFVLLPFEVRIPPDEVDPGLKARLLAELPGVMQWAYRGLAQWLAAGAKLETFWDVPAAAAAATEEYRNENDLFRQWWDARCVAEKDATVSEMDAYDDYRDWMKNNGYSRPWTKNSFTRALKHRGVVGRVQLKRVEHYRGFRLKHSF